MARKSNTNTRPAVTVKRDGDDLAFTWGQAALDRWPNRSGLRFEVGMAYVETNQTGRDLLIEVYGAGMVRRSLLVAARSNGGPGEKAILALRDRIDAHHAVAA